MNKLDLTETKTVMLDLGNTIQCMQIEKGNTTNLILQSHEFVAVIDKFKTTKKGEPFIKLAYVCNRPQEAYDKWLRVIGKLCKKDCLSKYFDRPRYEEHLTNGKCPESVKETIISIANTAISVCL